MVADTWNLEELRTAVERKIDLLRAADDSSGATRYQNVNEKGFCDVSTVSMTSSVREDACVFCQGDHNNFQCDNVLSNETHRANVIELELCFSCSRSNHSVKDCSVNTNCRHCIKRHHSLICMDQPTIK